MSIFKKIKQGLIKTDVLHKKQKIKRNLIESSIKIDYSKSLAFLRENKNQLPKTEDLMSVLETLQSLSYHYKTSESINKEQVFFSCIHSSKVNVQKAISELETVMDRIPFGNLSMITLGLMTEYKKELNP